jgi:hypothetical protein
MVIKHERRGLGNEESAPGVSSPAAGEKETGAGCQQAASAGLDADRKWFIAAA